MQPSGKALSSCGMPEREAESTDSTLASIPASEVAGQPLTQRRGRPSSASAAWEYTLPAALPAREPAIRSVSVRSTETHCVPAAKKKGQL